VAGRIHSLGTVGEERNRGKTGLMLRVNVVVEGQAEEEFVNRVMAPEFHAPQVFLFGRALQTGRRGGAVYRGGAVTFQRLRKEPPRMAG